MDTRLLQRIIASLRSTLTLSLRQKWLVQSLEMLLWRQTKTIRHLTNLSIHVVTSVHLNQIKSKVMTSWMHSTISVKKII